MSRPHRIRTNFWVKAAAVVVLALVFFSCGWAAQKAAEGPEPRVSPPVTIDHHFDMEPPGGKAQRVAVTTPHSSSDGTLSKEEEDRRLKEVQQLIAERKYRRIGTFEFNGVMQYMYEFQVTGDDHWRRSFLYPLENATDWNDLQEKTNEQTKQRETDIQDAVKNGRYRLVNVELLMVHICRDAATGKLLSVQSCGYGKEREAVITDYNSPLGERTTTPWKAHLDAIAAGERELINVESVNELTYEMTRADGTTFIFAFGGSMLPPPEGSAEGW